MRQCLVTLYHLELKKKKFLLVDGSEQKVTNKLHCNTI